MERKHGHGSMLIEQVRKKKCLEELKDNAETDGLLQDDNTGNSISNVSTATTVTIAEASFDKTDTNSFREKKQLTVDKIFQNISSYSEGGKNASKVTNSILYMIATDI
jgi:hypothetical protein